LLGSLKGKFPKTPSKIFSQLKKSKPYGPEAATTVVKPEFSGRKGVQKKDFFEILNIF
jgi:hypothetical protein